LQSSLIAKLRRAILHAMPPSVAGKLRAWKSRRLIQNFRPRVVEHHYGGAPLKVLLVDPLSQGWYDADWPDLPEITELKGSRLKPGATVFDVGAHQAVVAMMLARETTSTGRVIAVEPNRHNADAARKNCELNGYAHIEVVRSAVSDHDGEAILNEGMNCRLDDGTGAWGRQRVDCITLDSLAERFGMPDVVFLDVEGAECLALSGARQVLDKGADFFVEVHVGHGLEDLGGSVAALLRFFPADRYRLAARSVSDLTFRPFQQNDSVVQDRFFLLAFSRNGDGN
jgi:FkbM family methyltransferase